MFSFIKQLFIISLSFRKCLAIKSVLLNNEPCIIKTTVID